MDEKFLERWANVYVDKLTKSGNEVAKAWALKFLPEEYIPPVAERVREILKKRGFKIRS